MRKESKFGVYVEGVSCHTSTLYTHDPNECLSKGKANHLFQTVLLIIVDHVVCFLSTVTLVILAAKISKLLKY